MEIDTLLQRMSTNPTFSPTTIILYCVLVLNSQKPSHVLLPIAPGCLWLLTQIHVSYWGLLGAWHQRSYCGMSLVVSF